MNERYRVPVDEESPDSGESLADQERPSSNGSH